MSSTIVTEAVSGDDADISVSRKPRQENRMTASGLLTVME